MNSGPIKVQRQLKHTRSRYTTLLAIYFFAVTIIPSCILANTEPYSIWTIEALIFIPLGLSMIWSVTLKRSGITIWLAFPYIIVCAFQIVLLYLFGNSIIATDMFTNILTTNPGEAGELLANIYPAVIIVFVIYVPLLWFASLDIAHRRYLTRTTRMVIGLTGTVALSLGMLALWPAYNVSEERHVIRDEIFPFNVAYNAYLCGSEFRKTKAYEKTSADFKFKAVRDANASQREVYVYIIGEAARAMNWQLYGYERETTPHLSKMDDLVVFRDVLTQSNTTHKSVPLMLSSVDTHEHEELYRRRGLPALMNEAGFETWFISNQSRQGAMVDKLSADARNIIYVESPRRDMQLLDQIDKALNNSKAEKICIILHTYGSHYSYHARYPREFAKYLPDNDVAITEQNKHIILNSYDNSTLYTDYFLSRTIEYFRKLNACSAILYCSDHGEDMIDDKRGRFLHASPTTTAYQIYVPSLAWFSPSYRQTFPDKVAAAATNACAPTTSRAMFHTLADIASVKSEYVDCSRSLVSSEFDHNSPRRYLNDHNQAVPYTKTGLCELDLEVFEKFGIKL